MGSIAFSLPLFCLFSILPRTLFSAATATPSSKEMAQISAIVSGSACPRKQSKKIKLDLNSESLTVPMDFAVDFQTDGRKTCQARITFNPGPNKQFEIQEISQNLLFNLKEKMSMNAEISFGIVGGQEFKIDDSVKELGQYRRILTKKLIGYSTPCGKETMFRLQTDIKFQGKGSASFSTEPMTLAVVLKDCEALIN